MGVSANPNSNPRGRNVLGLGQGTNVLTGGFTENVRSEGYLGRVHLLSEGDADGAKGVVSCGMNVSVRCR